MKQRSSIDELIDHRTLLPGEPELLRNKTSVGRMGFAVMLKSSPLEKEFPYSTPKRHRFST